MRHSGRKPRSEGPPIPQSTLLTTDAIRLGQSATDRWDAIAQVGRTLHDIGATTSDYAEDMRKRELSSSTYIGRGIAIPHGTYDAHHRIHRCAFTVLQFPDDVAWDGHTVQLCVGIAATGDRQIGLLCSLAQILMDADSASELREAFDPASVMRLLEAAQQ
jgi:PTS system mannitol-specific IIA component